MYKKTFAPGCTFYELCHQLAQVVNIVTKLMKHKLRVPFFFDHCFDEERKATVSEYKAISGRIPGCWYKTSAPSLRLLPVALPFSHPPVIVYCPFFSFLFSFQHSHLLFSLFLPFHACVPPCHDSSCHSPWYCLIALLLFLILIFHQGSTTSIRPEFKN